MKAFAEKFFAYPYQVAYEDAEMVLYGANGKHGLFKAVGRTSFTGSLRNSSAYALELLARLVSQQTNPHSYAVFLGVAQTIDEKGLEAMRLNDHLKHSHDLSTKEAALKFINLLKSAPAPRGAQLKVERKVVTLREAKEAAAAAVGSANSFSSNQQAEAVDLDSSIGTSIGERRTSSAPSSNAELTTTSSSVGQSNDPNDGDTKSQHGESTLSVPQPDCLQPSSSSVSSTGGYGNSTRLRGSGSISISITVEGEESKSESKPEKSEKSEKSSSFRSALRSLTNRLFNRESRESLVKKAVIKDELFGRDLSQIIEGASKPGAIQYMDERGIPKFLTQILDYISATPEVLNMEGLFRTPAAPEGLVELKQLINAGETLAPSEWDPHALTGIVKQWLRELPTPLVPFELYEPLIDAFKSGDAPLVRQLLGSISEPALTILRNMIACLCKVASASAVNGMNEQSLCIIMAPNLFRPKVQVYAKVIQDMPATIGVLQLAMRDHNSGVYIGDAEKIHAVTAATTGTIMGATMKISSSVGANLAAQAGGPSSSTRSSRANIYATTRVPASPSSVKSMGNQSSKSLMTSPDFFSSPDAAETASTRGTISPGTPHPQHTFVVNTSETTQEQLPPDVLAAISAATSATAANLAKAGATLGTHQNHHLLNVSSANTMRRMRHTAVGFAGAGSAGVQPHHSSAFAFRSPHAGVGLHTRAGSAMNPNPLTSQTSLNSSQPGLTTADLDTTGPQRDESVAVEAGSLPRTASFADASEAQTRTDSGSLVLPAFNRPASLSLSSRSRKPIALEAAAAAAAAASVSIQDFADDVPTPNRLPEAKGEPRAGTTQPSPDPTAFTFTTLPSESRPRDDSLSSTPAIEAPVLSKVMSLPQQPVPNVPEGPAPLPKSSSFDSSKQHRDSLGETPKKMSSVPAPLPESDAEGTGQTSSISTQAAPQAFTVAGYSFDDDDDEVPPPPPPPGIQIDCFGNPCTLDASSSLLDSRDGNATTVVSLASHGQHSTASPMRRGSSLGRRGSRIRPEADYPQSPDQELAPGWAEFVDVSGAKYFYHAASNAASWIRPCLANKHLVQLQPKVRSRRPTALAVAYPNAAAEALQQYKQAGGEALYEDEDDGEDAKPNSMPANPSTLSQTGGGTDSQCALVACSQPSATE